jgi:hypothetical protein
MSRQKEGLDYDLFKHCSPRRAKFIGMARRMMQSTEHDGRIILSLAHFRPSDFQAAENLLVRGLTRMGQCRLGLLAWSELRPTDVKGDQIAKSSGRQRTSTKLAAVRHRIDNELSRGGRRFLLPNMARLRFKNRRHARHCSGSWRASRFLLQRPTCMCRR